MEFVKFSRVEIDRSFSKTKYGETLIQFLNDMEQRGFDPCLSAGDDIRLMSESTRRTAILLERKHGGLRWELDLWEGGSRVSYFDQLFPKDICPTLFIAGPDLAFRLACHWLEGLSVDELFRHCKIHKSGNLHLLKAHASQ